MTNAEPIVIELRGHVPSKKNAYTPRANGSGMFKNTKLQAALDRLALQISGEFRDLKLESPEIQFYFVYEKANWDRDGAVTSLLDILVQMGVLKNDNLASCNGLMSIYPAVRGEYDSVRIVLTPAIPADGPVVTRYINPKRRLRLPAAPVPADPLAEFPDLTGDLWQE